MKKIMISMALVLGIYFSNTASAQWHVSVNIGNQPAWGPSGYDYARYYYIPDMDAYYDVNARVYIYNNGGRWVRTTYVPAQYRNVDLYRVHKVVINDPNPWIYHQRYHGAYYTNYRGRYDQTPIRDHHDNGNHNGWYKHGDGDNGNHNGWDKHGHGDNGNHGHGHGHGRD